jgi:2-keto-4-pentenoate hydratase
MVSIDTLVSAAVAADSESDAGFVIGTEQSNGKPADVEINEIVVRPVAQKL